jgi:hypothetical protein
MFPSDEIKPYPGLKKANAFFRDNERGSLIKTSRHPVL